MSDRIYAISQAGQPQAWTPAQVKTWAAIVISDVTGLQPALDAKASLTSGYLVSAQLPGFTGDVTAVPGSSALTIAPGAVTPAKLAPQATATLLGNNTGSSSSPLALTAAQAKALLAVSYADLSGVSAICQAGAAQYLTGTLPVATFPAFTGDISNTAGTVAMTIAAGAVSLGKMAALPSGSILGNNTGGSATAQYLSVSAVKSMLAYQISEMIGVATVAITGSYTDLTNRPTIPSAQVNSDWNASSGLAQILNKPVLATVAVSGAASDLSGTLAAARLPALSGDVASAVGSSVLTIQTAVVTLPKLAAIPTLTLVGNNTGASASPTALTGAQVAALLPTFTTSVAGVVPAPGSTSGKFLRDDATWAPASAAGGLLAANNLSDVASASTSLANLGGINSAQALVTALVFG